MRYLIYSLLSGVSFLVAFLASRFLDFDTAAVDWAILIVSSSLSIFDSKIREKPLIAFGFVGLNVIVLFFVGLMVLAFVWGEGL